jgi:hypothetical protein
VALGNRDLWCPEHGSHVGRTLVENRILIEWMAGQDQDEVYQQFKNYGAGKAKLYSLLAAELPRDWLTDAVDEAISAIEAAVGHYGCTAWEPTNCGQLPVVS